MFSLYRGKDSYEFGDISKALDAKAKAETGLWGSIGVTVLPKSRPRFGGMDMEAGHEASKTWKWKLEMTST